jgi:hypothetical protein
LAETALRLAVCNRQIRKKWHKPNFILKKNEIAFKNFKNKPFIRKIIRLFIFDLKFFVVARND